MRYTLLILLLSSFLNAHQSGLSYIEMTQNTQSDISVVYKKPLGDIQADDIIIKFPSSCYKSTPTTESKNDGFIIKKYTLECGENGLFGSRIWVEGLVRSDRGVIAIYKNNDFLQQALFKQSTPFVMVDKHYSKQKLFLEYLDLGTVHILKGYDHLMFVFLLLLLAVSKRRLLIAITAFTISHSLTLAFSIFDLVSISIAYVEAMIALSIVFLAREVLVYDANSLTNRYLALIAFLFGLLHGFGFSSVLSSIGLPQGEIPIALFSFNIGIEIGQLIFVLIAYSILKLLSKYLSKYEDFILKVVVYAIGVVAFYWFLQRSLCPCV